MRSYSSPTLAAAIAGFFGLGLVFIRDWSVGPEPWRFSDLVPLLPLLAGLLCLTWALLRPPHDNDSSSEPRPITYKVTWIGVVLLFTALVLSVAVDLRQRHEERGKPPLGQTITVRVIPDVIRIEQAEPAPSKVPIPSGARGIVPRLAASLALILFGTSLLALGVFVFMRVDSKRSRAAGVLVASLGAGAAWWGGVDLHLLTLEFDNVIGEARLVVERGKNSPAPKASKPYLVRLCSVGPFGDADHQIDPTSGVDHVRREIASHPSAKDALAWLIVGRADRRALKPGALRYYGSNEALAMARAIWVRDEILREVDEFDAKRALVTVAGPEHVGMAIEERGLARDRVVEIYALVDPTLAATGSASNST